MVTGTDNLPVVGGYLQIAVVAVHGAAVGHAVVLRGDVAAVAGRAPGTGLARGGAAIGSPVINIG